MIQRKQGLNLWVVLVLPWALFRAFVVNFVFHQYGVNAGVYLAVDLISSVPYAVTSGRAVFAFLDQDNKN